MTTVIPRVVAPSPETAFVARPRVRRLGPGRPIPFARLLGVALLFAAWAVGSASGWLDPRKLSAPWTVATTAWDLFTQGDLLSDIRVSVTRAAIGLAIGVVIGVALALMAGLSRWGEAVVDGPVQLKRSIPTLGLIPLMILLLGIDEAFKIVLITIGVVIHMYVQVHGALTTIDQRHVELAEVQRATRMAFIRDVVIPGSLPGFFLGLRLSVTGAWLYLVVVESVNATDGIGKVMGDAQNYGQSDVILVCLLVYGLFGLASDAGIRLVERRVLGWRRTISD